MTLEEIEKLCEEATPGPWQNEYSLVNGIEGRIASVDSIVPYRDKIDINAKFIAASRNLMPKLLAVAKAAELHFMTGAHMTEIHEALRVLEKE